MPADGGQEAPDQAATRNLQQTRPQSSGTTSDLMRIPRILIIDHDDSYTLNVLSTLVDALSCDSRPGAEGEDGSRRSSPCIDETAARERLAAGLIERTLVLRHTDVLLASPSTVRELLLPHFDAIVLSPGPGRPDNAGDFDAAAQILATFRAAADADNGAKQAKVPTFDVPLPTLGICLGHQGIATAFGGSVRRARYLRHGLASRIHIEEQHTHTRVAQCRWPSLFAGMSASDAMMTTYNSLVVDEKSLPPQIRVTAVAYDPAAPAAHGKGEAPPTERVVMALQHTTMPLWGVQFHPESVESQQGHRLLRNFLNGTRDYWQSCLSSPHAEVVSEAQRRMKPSRGYTALPEWIRARSSRTLHLRRTPLQAENCEASPQRFKVTEHRLGKLAASQAPLLFTTLFAESTDDPATWLDSSRPGGIHSRYSYMARPSWSLHYDTGARKTTVHPAKGIMEGVEVRQRKNEISNPRANVDVMHGLMTPRASRTNSPDEDVLNGSSDEGQPTGFWTWFDEVQKSLSMQCITDSAELTAAAPFCTGFVGYFGYEMKAESIAVRPRRTPSSPPCPSFPAASFGFCDGILVLDHESDEWTALGMIDMQPAMEPDKGCGAIADLQNALDRCDTGLGMTASSFERWIERIAVAFGAIQSQSSADVRTLNSPLPPLIPVDGADAYKAKIETARELIAQGQSYELCLTNEFRGTLAPSQGQDHTDEHFAIYERLRKRNPAPYSAFMRLDAQRSILSTSPEKFMGIDSGSGTVEMKPIKGTFARAGYGKELDEAHQLAAALRGEPESVAWRARLDQARREALRCDAKERAENLMVSR